MELAGRQIHIDQVNLGRTVSLALHPFLVSPGAIVLILWLDRRNLLEALEWAGLCAAFVVAPALLYLRDRLKRGAYTDADVSVREHRLGFYMFGGMCMVACFAALLWLGAPQVLVAGFAAALAALVVAVAVNSLLTKVSIHSGAMAGVTVAAAFYSLPLALALAAATIAVSWARLVTGRHTLPQAAMGWIVAVFCVLVVFWPLNS